MQLSDNVVAKLQEAMQAPDLTGTRYRPVRYLVRGGMGTVWLAEDTVLQRHVALKVLDLVAPTGNLADRLLQEARILAGLEHPGIVPVHDAGTLADGRAFYCMKYVEGQNLAHHIANMNLPDRLRLLERIAEPVDFAHARGFIHRDLKPENIMIGAFGEVLVMDWGLAKVGRADRRIPEKQTAAQAGTTPNSLLVTGHGAVLGTPGYMSPEQTRSNADIDHRTDIFSLGALLRFMLVESPSGEPLIDGNTPRPLRAICEKAMASDPDARYQSAREMTADLARYLDGSPVSAYSESMLERAIRIYRRHRVAVILVAVYLFMRLLFILLARR
jgi:eukaryotic-like serine/threonine-protein kinase